MTTTYRLTGPERATAPRAATAPQAATGPPGSYDTDDYDHAGTDTGAGTGAGTGPGPRLWAPEAVTAGPAPARCCSPREAWRWPPVCWVSYG